jgi:hypothetical protein
MTPKEKADELVLRYLRINNNTKEWFNLHIAKKCALIAVDEIINSSPLEPNFADWDDCGGEHRYWYDAQKTHKNNVYHKKRYDNRTPEQIEKNREYQRQKQKLYYWMKNC